MGQLEVDGTAEIIKLHNEIIGHLKSSMEKAIRIGELLMQKKQALKHGEFIPWASSSLPFGTRQAQKYIQLFNNKQLLDTNRSSHFAVNGALREIRNQKKIERKRDAYIEIEKKRESIKGKTESDSWIGTAGHGWKCKFTITGYLKGYPIIHTECIDHEYHRLETGAVDHMDFGYPVDQMNLNCREIERSIKKLLKKYPEISQEMYVLSWSKGPKYPLKQFVEQWGELKKTVGKFLEGL